MSGFLKNLDKLALGMLSQNGHLPTAVLAALAQKLVDDSAVSTLEKKPASYLPTPALHDAAFRVCG